jgi:hypothetical protein
MQLVNQVARMADRYRPIPAIHQRPREQTQCSQWDNVKPVDGSTEDWHSLIQEDTDMNARLLTICLVAFFGLMSSPVSSTLATDGLEEFDYNEMTLLKVFPGGDHAGSACFFASHDYAAGGMHVWVHLHEAVGNRNGVLETVLTDRVKISQVQAVNGNDWVPIEFYWPLATGKDTETLTAQCGNRPDR